MNYSIGQYAKPLYSNDNQFFMEQLAMATSTQEQTAPCGYYIRNLEGDKALGMQTLFPDPYIQPRDAFKTSNIYYAHVHIKRLKETQIYNIVLMDIIEEGGEQIYKEQVLKTIEIYGHNGVNDNQWANVELSFTPLQQYKYLLFKLQRNSLDYNGDPKSTSNIVIPRVPVVKFIELSQVNDILHNKDLVNLEENERLIKIGIHSNPGMTMYINGSEVLVGKSGVYELHNSIVAVDKFSVIAPLFIINQEALDGNEFTTTTNYNQYILGAASDILAMETLGFKVSEKGVITNHFTSNSATPASYSEYIGNVVPSSSDAMARAVPGFTLDYVKEKETED